MRSQKILVLDDESTLRSALFRSLERKGYSVLTASRIDETPQLPPDALDLAIVDLMLPDGDGIEFMGNLKRGHPGIQVIILTGHGNIETAVKATRLGAFHFMTKPFNMDEFLSIVEKSLSHKKLSQENVQLKNELSKKATFQNIIGESESIRNVMNLVSRVADSDSTVLIMGESGTGKELFAKAIHNASSRASQPFIPINCGAIPSELLESELFGHVKGAFTGAIANRCGRFELAEEGTIFLDEIGDLAPHLQVKLLRVLQEKAFEPVGSTKTMTADVRVIAATNANLEMAVANKTFREDLYYRLNVIPMIIPPLRDRPTDIPILLNHFLQSFGRNRNRQLDGFSSEALASLLNYSWPGNIRELENLIERLSILKGSGIVELNDLPAKYQVPKQNQTEVLPVDISEDGVDFNTSVDHFENALILRALEKTGWNRNQAAILLKLNRTTLVEKIKKKGLRPPAGIIDSNA